MDIYITVVPIKKRLSDGKVKQSKYLTIVYTDLTIRTSYSPASKNPNYGFKAEWQVESCYSLHGISKAKSILV